ncbi:MAG: hypothetical protein IJN80_05210 [Clostridia bacterium]|nr:hypothetical protein [Clostridia bacterium]
MNWAVIVAAASFAVAVLTAVFRFSKAAGELVGAVNGLKGTFNKFENNSRQTHKEIFHELDEHGKKLSDHEARIKVIEKEKAK